MAGIEKGGPTFRNNRLNRRFQAVINEKGDRSFLVQTMRRNCAQALCGQWFSKGRQIQSRVFFSWLTQPLLADAI
jgi:hypothetical protein